jgi:hypothetical protein
MGLPQSPWAEAVLGKVWAPCYSAFMKRNTG